MGAATPPFQGEEFAFSFSDFNAAVSSKKMWDMLSTYEGSTLS